MSFYGAGRGAGYEQDSLRDRIEGLYNGVRNILNPKYNLYVVTFKSHPASQTEGHAVVSAKSSPHADALVSDEIAVMSGSRRDFQTEVQRANFPPIRDKGIVAIFMPD